MPKDERPDGFSEAPTAYEAPAVPRLPPRFKVTVGPGGGVVIPAEVRRALGIEEGTVLITHLLDDEWRVITAEAGVRRAQATAAKYKKPGVDEVDAFLAERKGMWGEV